jgi:NACalpha-BTF3-like transcription factor
MTPEAAVARLAELMDTRDKLSQDDIYTMMREAGIPDPVADRALKFTQIAWGRVFLGSFGVRFSPDYFSFNAVGDVVEQGLLREQPYFAAAMSLARRYANTPGFQRLAVMSADVDAVNRALNAGSKAENLVTSPAALFFEVATPAGMEKARKLIAQKAAEAEKEERSRRLEAAERPARPTPPAKPASSAKPASPAKPWWRFWS